MDHLLTSTAGWVEMLQSEVFPAAYVAECGARGGPHLRGPRQYHHHLRPSPSARPFSLYNLLPGSRQDGSRQDAILQPCVCLYRCCVDAAGACSHVCQLFASMCAGLQTGSGKTWTVLGHLTGGQDEVRPIIFQGQSSRTEQTPSMPAVITVRHVRT